jgi:hypothetical protein
MRTNFNKLFNDFVWAFMVLSIIFLFGVFYLIERETQSIANQVYEMYSSKDTTEIDTSYTDEDVMWIGNDGDTIWE